MGGGVELIYFRTRPKVNKYELNLSRLKKNPILSPYYLSDI